MPARGAARHRPNRSGISAGRACHILADDFLDSATIAARVVADKGGCMETDKQKIERLERRIRELTAELESTRLQVSTLQSQVGMLGGYYP